MQGRTTIELVAWRDVAEDFVGVSFGVDGADGGGEGTVGVGAESRSSITRWEWWPPRRWTQAGSSEGRRNANRVPSTGG